MIKGKSPVMSASGGQICGVEKGGNGHRLHAWCNIIGRAEIIYKIVGIKCEGEIIVYYGNCAVEVTCQSMIIRYTIDSNFLSFPYNEARLEDPQGSEIA